MRKTSLFLIAMFSAPLALSSEKAFDWWWIDGWGELPARAAVFVDAHGTGRTQDAIGLVGNTSRQVVRVKAQVVHESPASPDNVEYTFEVDCSAQALREYSVHTTHRDNRLTTTPPDHVSRQAFTTPAPDAWQRRVIEFTCQREKRTPEHGMLYMGGTEIYPTYLAWKLWPETQHSDLESGKSFEELKAENEARLAALESQISGARAHFEGELAVQDEIDQRRKARMERWPRRGVWRDFYMHILEPHVGFSEPDLVARWGQPSRVITRPGQRLLVYEQGYDEVTSGNRGVLGHGEISRVQHRCAVTFAIANSKVIDYAAEGDYCLKVYAN